MKKWGCNFLKGISLNANAKVWLELKIVYIEVAVKHFRFKVFGTFILKWKLLCIGHDQILQEWNPVKEKYDYVRAWI